MRRWLLISARYKVIPVSKVAFKAVLVVHLREELIRVRKENLFEVVGLGTQHVNRSKIPNP